MSEKTVNLFQIELEQLGELIVDWETYHLDKYGYLYCDKVKCYLDYVMMKRVYYMRKIYKNNICFLFEKYKILELSSNEFFLITRVELKTEIDILNKKNYIVLLNKKRKLESLYRIHEIVKKEKNKCVLDLILINCNKYEK